MNSYHTIIKDITTSNKRSLSGCFEKRNKYHKREWITCHDATYTRLIQEMCAWINKWCVCHIYSHFHKFRQLSSTLMQELIPPNLTLLNDKNLLTIWVKRCDDFAFFPSPLSSLWVLYSWFRLVRWRNKVHHRVREEGMGCTIPSRIGWWSTGHYGGTWRTYCSRYRRPC